MARVEVTGDRRGVATLDRQIVFAAARALTQTAKQGQEASIEAIKSTFTTRGAWYLPNSRFGVRIRPADKARLESVVTTLADWLIPHETGEDKVAAGGGLLAVPLVGRGRPRPTFGSKVRRELKPSALGRGGFVRETASGPALFYRRGRNVVAMYGLEKRAKIRRRSTVIEPTVRVADRRFGENLGVAIAAALATAK